MGCIYQALRVQFDSKLKIEFRGTRITSEEGLLAFRELDEAFRLKEQANIKFSDARRGKNTQHRLLAMLRQAVYSRLAGYEDVNDAERLRVGPRCATLWEAGRWRRKPPRAVR